MKRIVLITMMFFAVAGVWAQDLEAFQEGFENFADALAPTLSYNATIGNNWSDAYIGNFPHFGIGLAVGATTVPAPDLDLLFVAMNIAMPAELENIGLPIPAAALSAKLGGFILPFDIGLKAMVLPDSLKNTLSEAGLIADYTLFGGNVRYAVLKENLIMPDVSIGAGYNRLSGSIGMTLDTEVPSFTFYDGSTDRTIAATNPELAIDWTTDSYDLTLQVSKNFLFIRPYAGAGYSFGKSTVSGGLKSDVTYDGSPITQDQLDDINATLVAAGSTEVPLSATGILFGKESTDPALRIYGGVSMSLLIVHFDFSVSYVPLTSSLGASAMVLVKL